MLPRGVVFIVYIFLVMSLRVLFQSVPNIDKTRLWFFHKFEIRVLYDRLEFFY